MTAYEQRSYPGAAADTLLNADMASNALTFSVSPGTGNGYPTGGSGPFFIAIDYDTSKAEKIRVTSRINDTFTIASLGDRGVDGTSAVAHSANAKVRAVWTATDAQEANRAAANTVGKVTAKGDLLAGTGANALARVPVGGDGTLLVAASGATPGVAWTTAATVDGNGNLTGPNGVYAGTPRTYYTSVTGVASGAQPAVVFAAPSLAQSSNPYGLEINVTSRDVNGYDAAARFRALVLHEATNAAIVIGGASDIITANGNPGYSWSNTGSLGYVLTASAIAADASSITLTVTNNGAVAMGFRMAIRAVNV